MKNKLRVVHINGIAWKYVISSREVRIYDPKTNQIKERIPHSKLMWLGSEVNRWEGENLQPSAIKEYIKTNYETNNQK